jgi:hypothetical protein
VVHRTHLLPAGRPFFPQGDCEWLVVDAGSVVVHVFEEGARLEYNLEGLWGGADGVHVSRPEVAAAAPQTLHTLR